MFLRLDAHVYSRCPQFAIKGVVFVNELVLITLVFLFNIFFIGANSLKFAEGSHELVFNLPA